MSIPSDMWCADCVKDQQGASYTVWQTLSPEQQAQLLEFSQKDPLILQNTSDAERFSSPDKLAIWMAGNRLLFVLTPQDNPRELAGLFWFSSEDFPLKTTHDGAKNSHWTMAIRLYETARGKRLSFPFMQAAFEYFWQKYPGQSVWLSTSETNDISQKIYTQFGFEKVTHQDGRVFYIRSV